MAARQATSWAKRARSLRFGMIDAVLEQPSLFALARVLMTFMFWLAGVGFLLDYSSAVQMIRSFGLEPAADFAAAVIVVLLGGSALVIDGRLAWLGAAMLGAFTLATIPLVHHFWTMTGVAATQARLESEEHVSVVGGLILVAILCEVQRRRMRAA